MCGILRKFLLLVVFVLCLGLEIVGAFVDVGEGHRFEEAVGYLEGKGVVKGYEDGSFRPDKSINRAEFLKIVLGAGGVESGGDSVDAGCFSDVAGDIWYVKYICRAKELGIVKGYDDGSFRPGEDVKLVEALKIILETNEVVVGESDVWYEPYLVAMGEKNYIPDSLEYLEDKVTRGEMVEMIWRLETGVSDKSASSVEDLKKGCSRLDERVGNVDMDRVRQTWLGWYNGARSGEGLAGYSINPQLNRTATEWSNFSADRGYIDHKRPGTSAYYDYNAITRWYKNLGLEFANWHGVTHSENIGWNVYKCDAADCTDYMIKQLRPTFDFYMAEKNKAYRAHYNSVMNSQFKEIGLGVAVSGGKVFVTTHYGTEISSNPLPVCGFN